MSAINFALDVVLDGDPFTVARGDLGQRQVAVSYVPKIRAASQNAVGEAMLDPIEYTTWHRGAGASRAIGVPGMVAYTENGWTLDPGLFMPGPEVTGVTLTGATAAPRPDGVAEADGHIFVAAGRYVFRLTNGQATSPTPSQDLDLGVGNVGLAVKRFGTGLFLSSGALRLYERPDGGVWTNALLGASGVFATGALGTVFWTTGDAGSEITAERLVAQFGPRTIRYCSASPRLDTSWTPGLAFPAIDIGGTIQRFATTLDHLYIATTSGLRDLDFSGLAPNLTPDAESEVMPSGGLAALAQGGKAYVSAAYQLLMVNVAGQDYAQGKPVTPMVALPNETPVAGYGTDLVARGQYLIYAMYDPVLDVTWICWGREASAEANEIGPMVWNVAPIVLHGFRVTSMHISGLATDGPRLWLFGQTLAGAVSAKWAPLAYTTPYADLKAGRGRRFSQTCFGVMPSEDGGTDAIQKDVEEVMCEAENLLAGNSVRFSAAHEGDTSFTQLANFTNSPRAVQQVASAFVSQRPTFKIDLNGSPISPPIVRRVSVRWLPNPDLREVRRYLFPLGRNQQSAGGSYSGRDPEEQLAKLVRLATAAARVTFTDERGKNLIVRVLKVDGPAEVESALSNEQVLAAAVTISIFGAQPGPPFGYDQGVSWDSGHSWS